ncbi:MAG: hypothetical protein EZS28_011019 [Streblomastix strix]|uniref:Uncharacterized protein n=1 Tax=Streblomastix strix TaxID=222440 RepID=A0A5J4WEQ4_9EUKA|nr:MAG: hypothetical protein EZS28_011019 [Streblomastix strix]
MDQAHALKNLIENGTQIEYFDNGYIMQVKDKIKVYEDGKKSARALTQAQQNKLLLQARGGGIEKKKIQKPIEEEDEAVEYENETEGSQSQSEVREKPLKKVVRKRTVKSSKQPQINYTNPQIDLEELIRLRTENTFIKQQHQDAIKQVEKYKQKIKGYKQPKKQVEEREEIREEEPENQQFWTVMAVVVLVCEVCNNVQYI